MYQVSAQALFIQSNLTWLRDATIFLTLHGSHAYGTNTPASDLDFKGVAVPPRQYFHGFLNRFEQAEFKRSARSESDAVIFDVRKFISLAADCNPSIIEVLFTDPANHVITTPLSAKLLASRDLFVSRKAKHTFSRYAVSQLKKIQSHRHWLLNPPTHAPTRAEFGLPERTVIPADQLNAARSLVKKQVAEWSIPTDALDPAQHIEFQERFHEALAQIKVNADVLERIAGGVIGLDSNMLVLLDAERKYQVALREWQKYQEWLVTRNPARLELERKFGYDTKHGMHLVRLVRMGEEILMGHGVLVRRPDAKELLEIRNGAWSYEALLTWANDKLAEMEVLYKRSPLPHAPDRARLDLLCEEIVETHLMNRGLVPPGYNPNPIRGESGQEY
jgi:predicted nucleotidyltransferase